MSPESETRVELIRLLAELDADLGAASHRATELSRLLATGVLVSGAPSLAVAALGAHHLYTALESAVERCVRAFEGTAPSDGNWHRELLRRAELTLPEVRPAVLSSETVQALGTPLRFRHFVRHAYAVELDAAELVDVVEKTLRAWTLAASDLARFRQYVEACMRPEESSGA